MTTRLYSVQFNTVTVSAVQDLFEIVPAAAKPAILHRICLSQTSEIGDAMEENLLILLKTGATTSGSGGTAPTAVPVGPSDAAFGGTTEVNNTTRATGGTILTHYCWGWNIRVPFDYVLTPEDRKVIAGGARMTLELATAPADPITMHGFIIFEEIG